MSNSIDQRIVQMEFDNAQFEKGVKSTLDGLKTLEERLSMKKASSGIENVDGALHKMDVDSVSAKVEGLENRFSVLSVTAANAVQRISNGILDMGENIVRGATIQPLLDGLDEYHTKLKSVQTIMTNTSSEFLGKSDAEHIQAVNDVISELNTYADKTIYNFSEMTRNIGTFTAAGVDLETSSRAIQGIANLAASSGSDANQASHAMYQLSQALSSGSVRLQDWVSVVNSGMGGKLFQDALTRTSEAFHRVNEESISASEQIEKAGSFRESLKSGWLTSDILTQTLDNFRLFYDGMSEADEKAAKNHLKSLGYTEEEIERIKEESKEAYDAATKVKSFDQLIDTTKEALGSGWAQTWEYIIGNLEQARAFFTPISETLNGFIDKMADARNSVLEVWSLGDDTHQSGRDALVRGLQALGEALLILIEPLGKALDSVFGNVSADSLIDMSVAFENFATGIRDFIKESPAAQNALRGIEIVFTALFTAVKLLGAFFGGVFLAACTAISLAFQTVGVVVSGVADGISRFVSYIASGLTSASSAISNFGSKLADITGLKPLKAFFYNLGNVIEEFAKKLSGDKTFSESKLLVGLNKLREAASKLLGPLGKLTGGDILKPLNDFFETGGEAISSGVFDLLVKIGDNLSQTFKSAAENIGPVVEYFNDLGKSFADSTGVAELVPFFESLGSVIEHIANVVTGKETMDDVAESLGSLGTAFDNLAGPLSEFGSGVISTGANVLGAALEAIGSVLSMIPSALVVALGLAFRILGAGLSLLFSVVSLVATPIIEFFNGFSEAVSSSNVGSELTEKAELIGEGAQAVSDNVNKAKGAFDALASIPKGIGEGLGNFFTNMSNGLGSIIENINLEGIGKVLLVVASMGIGVAVVVALRNFAKAIGALKEVGEAIISIGDIIGEVKDLIKAQRMKIMAEAIKSTAVAVGIIAASIVVLTYIDHDKMYEAVPVMLGIAAVVGLLMYAMAKLSDQKSTVNTSKMVAIGASLVSVGIALAIMAGVLVMLSLLPVNFKGVLTAVGIIAGFMVLLKATDKLKNSEFRKARKAFKGIRDLALSLIFMWAAIELLGHMDPAAAFRGIAAVGAILLLVGIMVKLMTVGKGLGSETKNIKTISKAMTNIAILIGVCGIVVKMLGGMELGQIIQGVAAVGILLILVGALIKFIASVQAVPGGLKGVATTLLSAAVAIGIFAGAIALLAMVSSAGGNVIGAVITLGLALLALAGVCVILSKISGPMLGAAAAILVISLALGVFAVAVTAISFIPWDVLGSGLLKFAGILLAAVVAFAAFAAVGEFLGAGVLVLGVFLIAFGVAMTLVAGAILIGVAAMTIFTAIAPAFIPAFQSFTNALIALFQTENFVVQIIGMALAMTVLGAACLVLGVGLGLLGLVVNAMPGTFTKVAADILNAIMLITTGITAMGPQISNAITTALTSIVMGIVGFISNMWQLATSLARTFAEGLKNFDWAGAAYSLVTTLGGALMGALRFLVEDLPGIIMDIGGGILDGIGDLLKDPLSDFGNWLSDLTGIGEKTSEEVQDQLEQAKEGYTENKEQLNEAIREGEQGTADALAEGGDQTAEAAAAATDEFKAKMEERKAALSGEGGGSLDIMSMLGIDTENMDASAITDKLGEIFGTEMTADLGQKIKDGMSNQDILGELEHVVDPEVLQEKLGADFASVDLGALSLGGEGEGGGLDMTGLIAQDVDPEAMSEKAHEAATAFTDTFNEDMNSGIDINIMDSITAAFDPGALQEAFSGMFAEVDLGAAFGENLSAQLGNIDIGASLNLDAGSLSKQANDAVKAVVEPLNSMASQIKPNLTPKMNEALSQVRQPAKFKAASADDGRAVTAGFTSGSSGMRSAGANAGNAAASGVKGTASSGKSAGYSVGSDIGQGLVNGLKDKEDAAYQAGYRVGRAAVRGQKDGAASKSPSKIAIQTGKDIGEGLVIGVLAMKDSVYNAGYSTGSAAVASLSDATLSMGSLFDNLSDIDDQPTIRPVLDLTDYEAGINRMRGLGVGDQMVSAQWANRLGAMPAGQNGVAKSSQNNIYITLDWTAGASANDMVQEMANVLRTKNLMEA